MSDDQRRSRAVPAHLRVSVLDSFSLTQGGATVPLGLDARRLVAYLAVHPHPHQRVALAADLWPGTASDAALRRLADAANAVPGLVAGGSRSDQPLSLAGDVEVDLAEAMHLVRSLPGAPVDQHPDLTLLSADILPGWSAVWLTVERERFRQLRLHALEELSLRSSAAGRYTDAVAIAKVAVHSAPSRESARRALIEVHLAQGEVAAAVAAYDEYQELLRSSLGGPLPSGLEGLLPPAPAWPVLRVRRPVQRASLHVPAGRRALRTGSSATRRLVSGGSASR